MSAASSMCAPWLQAWRPDSLIAVWQPEEGARLREVTLLPEQVGQLVGNQEDTWQDDGKPDSLGRLESRTGATRSVSGSMQSIENAVAISLRRRSLAAKGYSSFKDLSINSRSASLGSRPSRRMACTWRVIGISTESLPASSDAA